MHGSIPALGSVGGARLPRPCSSPSFFESARRSAEECARAQHAHGRPSADARNKTTRSRRGCAKIYGHSSMPPLACLCLMCYSRSLYNCVIQDTMALDDAC
uniref:Uncharacterized protein n=1 Tax=Triticum urartu TaxID=4572 RepID=A0A8R7QNA2_TRIUA